MINILNTKDSSHIISLPRHEISFTKYLRYVHVNNINMYVMYKKVIKHNNSKQLVQKINNKIVEGQGVSCVCTKEGNDTGRD